MSFRIRNSQLLVRLQDQDHAATEAWWDDYADKIAAQLLSQGGLRFTRQMRGFLNKHMAYNAQDANAHREQDHHSALLWLTYQGYEETFLAAGRAQVTRRYFPEDEGAWRQRASDRGALFLLAREYLRSTKAPPAEDRREQTRRAVLLAEDWAVDAQVPSDHDLEAIALLVWLRRCQDIGRSMFRDELATWEHIENVDHIESLDTEPSIKSAIDLPPNGVSAASLSPAELFHKVESFSVVSHVFLSVCKDHLDRSILDAYLEDTTEHETATGLSLTRAQVRGRWNTLSSRARLLFKVISSADSPASGPLTTQGLAQGTKHKILQRRLHQHPMGPKETASSLGFWLDWFRLSAMLERERDSAPPDQKENWNALVQVWRRALEKLLEPVLNQQDPLLLRELVAFWSAAIQLTDSTPLSPPTHHNDCDVHIDGPPLAPGARAK